ncbi:MAG TPA: hypothetical protein EYG90_03475 [Campylobacterales bacterium]|nr:hypothetical protein [Campylobacterales bacterium]
MLLKKYLLLLALPLLFISCTSTEESSEKLSKSAKTTVEKIKKEEIPKKITILFITQPHCPSCDILENTMKLEKPARLINRYFTFKKVYLGEKLPEGLIPPNGTPTVYFLGYKDVALLEPMVGEKPEEAVVEFLEDALLEFKTLYGVDLEKMEKHHES